MSLTILSDENIPRAAALFACFGEVRTCAGRAINRDMLKDVDLLLVRSVTRVDATLLHDTPVRFVGSATSGLDHIDLAYLQTCNIEFAHAPGANANSVVEYVLAAIGAVDAKLEHLFAGGTLGIVGYGHVGKALANLFRTLGINVRINDPWLSSSELQDSVPLEDVLHSDVVSVHCELTRAEPWPSVHLLNSETLACLPDNALLINASRGAVIDNTALLQLLQNRLDIKAVLDVWEGEPAINEKLLEAVDIGTAHIAGHSLDGKLTATQMLRSVAAGCFAEEYKIEQELVHSEASVDTTVLSAASVLSPAQLVRHLIQARYDIHQDDTLLREVVAKNEPAQAAAGFDSLRKNYRERRELAGSLVDYSGQQLRVLRALGCRLTQYEDTL